MSPAVFTVGGVAEWGMFNSPVVVFAVEEANGIVVKPILLRDRMLPPVPVVEVAEPAFTKAVPALLAYTRLFALKDDEFVPPFATGKMPVTSAVSDASEEEMTPETLCKMPVLSPRKETVPVA